MAKPAPVGGLVIRYDYLWASEEAQGREEGSKERPCAVVVAIQPSGAEPLRAIVCAITHSRPPAGDGAVEIPGEVKRYLGLDADQSWVVTSEVNIVDWDDPGIVPVTPGRWAYGLIPRRLAEQIRGSVMGYVERQNLPMVDRPKIEKRRRARERAGREAKD